MLPMLEATIMEPFVTFLPLDSLSEVSGFFFVLMTTKLVITMSSPLI